MNLYLEGQARVIDVAEKVSLDLAKQLTDSGSFILVEDVGQSVGAMFAAVLDGFESYPSEDVTGAEHEKMLIDRQRFATLARGLIGGIRRNPILLEATTSHFREAVAELEAMCAEVPIPEVPNPCEHLHRRHSDGLCVSCGAPGPILKPT